MELALRLVLPAVVLCVLPMVRDAWRRELARGRYWF